MSKERLEEIKNNITSNEVDSVNLHAADFVWLIEKAERVQELEENLEHGAKVAVKTAEKLHYEQQQNKRYREAIDKALHKCDLADDTGHDYTDEIRYELRKAS